MRGWESRDSGMKYVCESVDAVYDPATIAHRLRQRPIAFKKAPPGN
ncbi:hypothetical protein CLOSTASPAR_04009 [[Clostridium] asparagiforme DSM 15981]|uniref:Uncharacterized protein n=1 Tax=[Clostridium] asparagiforme DSM 15981 TaxID=518636 RepID=C0D417_9FIRM|nr:hypothetical protein CLOSTASPAR_04009 [[Clostridium] asparagiforme DSM 15981]